MNFQTQQTESRSLRAVCIARHSFLSEHIARFFAGVGIVTSTAVGLNGAADLAREIPPDVVICDYDLLASLPLHKWEQNPVLSKTPVVAVSLTRKVQELLLLDMDGIAGFLYLPTLDPAQALQIVHAAAARPRYSLPLMMATRAVEHS
jgi:DNA-binding NarL/FixJ family response regulator